MKLVAVLHYLEGEVMDWKNIISKDEDTEVLDEGLVNKIKTEILPNLKEMIDVLGISKDLITLHRIINSAEATISNIQGKTEQEIDEMSKSGYFQFLKTLPTNYMYNTFVNADAVITNALLQYEELRPNSIDRIANALERNIDMAKKFINLAAAMQIKVDWVDNQFRLSVGDYFKDVSIETIFDESGPEFVYECNLIRVRDRPRDVICLQQGSESRATGFDMELSSMATISAALKTNLGNTLGDIGHWIDYWIYLTSKGFQVDAWEQEDNPDITRLIFDKSIDAERFRRWKMEPFHKKYDKSSRPFNRRRGQTNDVIFPKAIEYYDDKMYIPYARDYNEIDVSNWGLSVKEHVAKFGDIDSNEYKDFSNFKLWREPEPEPEIVDAEIVDEDDERINQEVDELIDVYNRRRDDDDNDFNPAAANA